MNSYLLFEMQLGGEGEGDEDAYGRLDGGVLVWRLRRSRSVVEMDISHAEAMAQIPSRVTASKLLLCIWRYQCQCG